MAQAQDIKPDPDLAVRLRQADVLLLIAVHTADRATWLRFAAPDFFYLDEEGGVTYLDAFLNELAPMSTKPLEIQTFKLTRAGDTAIVLLEDTDEHQVHYIFTETWQQLKGDWRLRVLHITNVLSDPPAINWTAGGHLSSGCGYGDDTPGWQQNNLQESGWLRVRSQG
ncbi:MAG: nuclear transport factor 2 family protein [Verrucomicrobia bacterium]|nr:nuclear transport factor 2 family protein [Verrucomicrobiota bacterium]